MRWVRNAIVIFLILIISLWVLSKLFPIFNADVVSVEGDLDSFQYKDASIKLAYILNKDKWLSYTLQQDDELVRVMSNAVLDLKYKIKEDEKFLYSIKYEVISTDGKVIRSGSFYHRGAQKVYLDEETSQQYVSTGVYPREENPLDSRIHLINLRGLKNIGIIRFKSGEYNFPVKKIVLRAYEKKNISERKLEYSWQRMSEERRQKLAKASVYDASIMSAKEQQNLLKNQWAPLGPLGLDGDDYRIQKLYVVREVENDVVVNVAAVPSTGLVIYPGRYGVITLPVDFRQVKISWSLFDTSSVQQASDKIRIEWWGHPATRYKQWHSLISDGEIKLNAKSGILRISSEQPVVVRAWATTMKSKPESDTFEITPAPAYLRLFSADSDSLIYKVNHISGYKTPFRFDLRAIGENVMPNIEYRLVDKNNRVIKKGQLNIAYELSTYDTVVSEPQSGLTDPLKVYFNLPRRVARVEFDAPTGVWISAYSRPKNLAHNQVSPATYADIKSTTESSKRSSPVWFGVRPENWKDSMRKGRSQLITVQRRAPQVDQELLAGKYKWDQFFPENNWKGRYVLNAVDDNINVRDESLGSYYVKITPSEKTGLEFFSRAGLSNLRPSLIFVQEQKRKIKIRVWIDDRLLLEEKVYSKKGELLLPHISAGKYTLRVESEFNGRTGEGEVNKVNYYINNAKPRNKGVKPAVFIKRTLIEVSDATLNFNVQKEKSNELLALRIYTITPMSKPVTLKLKVNGLESRLLGPFDDWTITRRQYELNPVSDDTGYFNFPVTLNADNRLAEGKLFFIPLNSDMAINKEYKISVKLQQGNIAYMMLTRSMAGLYPSRRIYPDVEVETVNE